MSNYIEFKNKICFHPGYYIKEIVDESGLTQEDFAKRLGTTPKNLSILIRGDQSLSIEMANKLSRMLGTSVSLWLNLQQSYDEMQAECISNEELEQEKTVFKLIDYNYFCVNFSLPELKRKTEERIKTLREFLSVSSLQLLKQEDLAVSFRSYSKELSTSNIVNANAMVQVAVNIALKTDAPKFDKKKFEKAVSFALTQTKNHDTFLPAITKEFIDAGVILVALPNLKNSGINGATKRIDGKVMIMVNDRRHYEDTLWFTLFHEIGHVLNNDFGATVEGDYESDADLYARDILIPKEEYEEFVANSEGYYSVRSIRSFAESIDQDPGIVYGRLQIDGEIPYTDKAIAEKVRHRVKLQ